MIRANLFDELLTIHRNFDNLFNRAFERGAENPDVKWVPPFDAYVKDNQLVVRAFLPGIDQKNISVSLTDNVLTIQGSRTPLESGKDMRVLLSEVPYGKFERRITLPSEMLTDNDKCSARYENGVLEITAPIVAQYMQTRQIPVHSATEQKQLA